MSAYLDHIAVNTAQYEETLHFYTSVFGMTISRTAGDKPHRKAWLHQGIQINEMPEDSLSGNRYDHIAIRVSDPTETIQAAREYGCLSLESKPNWLCTNNGITIELIG